MLVLEAPSVTQLFPEAVAQVLQKGLGVAPRGQGTRRPKRGRSRTARPIPAPISAR